MIHGQHLVEASVPDRSIFDIAWRDFFSRGKGVKMGRGEGEVGERQHFMLMSNVGRCLENLHVE